MDSDTKTIILSVELKPPDMGFYGPPKKHVGFKGAPGPEETQVNSKSLIHMKDNVNKTDCEFDFDLTGEELLQRKHISVDHTICFVLEVSRRASILLIQPFNFLLRKLSFFLLFSRDFC